MPENLEHECFLSCQNHLIAGNSQLFKHSQTESPNVWHFRHYEEMKFLWALSHQQCRYHSWKQRWCWNVAANVNWEIARIGEPRSCWYVQFSSVTRSQRKIETVSNDSRWDPSLIWVKFFLSVSKQACYEQDHQENTQTGSRHNDWSGLYGRVHRVQVLWLTGRPLTSIDFILKRIAD